MLTFILAYIVIGLVVANLNCIISAVRRRGEFGTEQVVMNLILWPTFALALVALAVIGIVAVVSVLFDMARSGFARLRARFARS